MSAVLDYVLATFSSHPHEETVVLLSFSFVRLKRSFHLSICLSCLKTVC